MSPEEVTREKLKQRLSDELIKAFVRVDGFQKAGGKIIIKVGRIEPLDKRRDVNVSAFLEWQA